MGALTLTPLAGIPLVRPGDDLAAIVLAALDRSGIQLADGDVLVLAQKIVSKAEGRLVNCRPYASPQAEEYARTTGKDPRLVELVLREAGRCWCSRPAR
jgi:coenzyme F420-0:L-glutamate ligase/coenzyme F420-1:gamma-L-glutamate ligase